MSVSQGELRSTAANSPAAAGRRCARSARAEMAGRFPRMNAHDHVQRLRQTAGQPQRKLASDADLNDGTGVGPVRLPVRVYGARSIVGHDVASQRDVVPIGPGNRDARRPITAPVLFPECGDQRLHARFVLRREHEHWLVEIKMRPGPHRLEGGPHLLELPRNATSGVFVASVTTVSWLGPQRGPVSGTRSPDKNTGTKERRRASLTASRMLTVVNPLPHLVGGGPAMSAFRLVGGVPM
jgi:hypothetical protein